MSVAAFLPPVPGPPQDPLSWLLDARTGWRGARLDGVEVAPRDQSLALAPLAGSGRRLAEPGGGFGGLRLPSNVAAAPDGSLFLLDPQTGELKRFDPCRCRFEAVLCTAGLGDQPRQVLSPGGIGIRGDNLYLCDTGNHRLQIFSLRGFVLRAIWSPPAGAGLAQPWQPAGLAFDGRRRVLVADPANGCVHLFDPGGRWLECLSGLGTVKAIATDPDDRLYAHVEGEQNVRVLDLRTGKRLEPISRRDQVEGRFVK
ncbi:MAG: hypothetical protein GY788_05375, partial [bacterium]|nr:hypothetical protein [bacterium]